MSIKLENLVSSYVDRSDAYVGVDSGESYAAKKLLEQQIIDEIVAERIETIDREVRAREKERASIRDLEEFGSILFQCVALALLVGLLGSHVYGLIEALVYQPSADFNAVAAMLGTIIVTLVCIFVLLKNYVGRLFSATRRLIDARRESNDS